MRALITSEQIANRVRELGQEIRSKYPSENLLLICVLKGSVLFFADLARAIDGPTTMEFIRARSYEGTSSTGAVTLDGVPNLQDRHVVVVEDIVDTGLTLLKLRESIAAQSPASVSVVTLLDKPSRREHECQADFVGFTIEDHFVVGYGLDLDQVYRNLPYIAIYEGEA